MNKLYLIVPCAMLLVFTVFERDVRRKHREAAEARQAVELAAQAQEDLRRRAARAMATEDARQRAFERERQDAEREAQRQRDHEATMLVLEVQTDAELASASKLRRELSLLQTRLTSLRADQQQIEDEVFVLAKAVERQRINRRSEELELQRTTQMVAARLRESEWASGQKP